MFIHHSPRPPASKAKAAPRRRRLTDDHRRRVLQAVRIGNLTKLFGHRYGGGRLYVFPDDDAGRDDLRILIDHYAHANPAAMQRVIKARAPWLIGAERDKFIAEAARFPRLWTAQALAERLNLTESVRSRLRIRTIGSVDVSPELRKQMRKISEKRRKARARRAAGVKHRAQYLAENRKSREQPWKTLNMSRATYYRRLKSGETGPSAIKLPDSCGHTCLIEQAEPPKESSGSNSPRSATAGRSSPAVRPLRGSVTPWPADIHPDDSAAHRHAQMLREGAESPGDSDSCAAGFVSISECVNAAVALAERARFDRKDDEIGFKEAA